MIYVLLYSASVSVYFSVLDFASRSGGSALVFLSLLFHFPHICHEDQVCLAARDMNLDVECPSLCLSLLCVVVRRSASTSGERLPRRLDLALYLMSPSS